MPPPLVPVGPVDGLDSDVARVTLTSEPAEVIVEAEVGAITGSYGSNT